MKRCFETSIAGLKVADALMADKSRLQTPYRLAYADVLRLLEL
jgi:hypothetical protein